jgi:hypothetical protein
MLNGHAPEFQQGEQAIKPGRALQRPPFPLGRVRESFRRAAGTRVQIGILTKGATHVSSP